LGFTYSIGHDLLTEDRVVYPVLTGRHANIVSYRDSLTNKTFTCIGVVETKDIVKKTYLKLNNQITGIIYLDILTASNDITTSDEISKNKSDSIRQVKENELSKIEAAKKEIEQEKEIENPFSQIDYYYDEFNYTKKYNTSIQLPEKIADTSYYKTLMRFFTKKLQKV